MIGANAAGLQIQQGAIKPLTALSLPRFITALLFDYAVIAVFIMLGLAVLNGPLIGLIFIPAICFFIAARQHALLILMHETSHGLATKNSLLNDALGELLCGAPLFASMFTYRRDHLAHHKWTNVEADPDWKFKRENADERAFWSFPRADKSIRYWPRLWARAIRFQFKLIAGNQKNAVDKSGFNKNAALLARFRLGSYLFLAIALTIGGGWLGFLLFWIAPALIALPFIMRMRSIAEHFALPYRDPLSETRTVIFKSKIEEFLFAPHNIAYHLDHHLFAAVPFYNLPKLHALLMEDPAFADGAHINDGYFIGANTLNDDLKTTRPQRLLWPQEGATA